MFSNRFGGSTDIQSMVWRPLLYSTNVDQFGAYKFKVNASMRMKLESFFGEQRIVSALLSNTCSACGTYTNFFNISTCSRACEDCWRCPNSGHRGTDGDDPFALSTTRYVKTHFLLSDADIEENLFVLEVDDPIKLHGLSQQKVKLVVVKKAKEVAIAKFGGLLGLNKELKRHLKQWHLMYDKACQCLEEKTEIVIRFENGKKTRNSVCYNQGVYECMRFNDKYGLVYGLRGRNPCRAPPSIIVTNKNVAKARQMYPSVQHVYSNLVEALSSEYVHGSTILIDKNCNLGDMINDCDIMQCTPLLTLMHLPDMIEYDPNNDINGVGPLVADHVLNISCDFTLVGTSSENRFSISNGKQMFLCCSHSFIKLENLNLLIDPAYDYTDYDMDDFQGPVGPILTTGTLHMKNCVVEVVRNDVDIHFNRDSFGFCIAVAEYESSCIGKSGPCVVVEDSEFINKQNDQRCAWLFFDECRQGLGYYRFERNVFSQQLFLFKSQSCSVDFCPAVFSLNGESMQANAIQFVHNVDDEEEDN